MKRIGSGFTSAAYLNDNNEVILFSIDPVKELMCEFVEYNQSPHYPKMELIGTDYSEDVRLSIYRVEKLITMNRANKSSELYLTYEAIMSYLYSSFSWGGYKKQTAQQVFTTWMEKLRDSSFAYFADLIEDQFLYIYNYWGDEVTLDITDHNFAYRKGQKDIVFYDMYALQYYINDKDFRINKIYPDKKLRAIYSE